MTCLKQKHFISENILGALPQASKDGSLLIIIISFLNKKRTNFFLTITQ